MARQLLESAVSLHTKLKEAEKANAPETFNNSASATALSTEQ